MELISLMLNLIYNNNLKMKMTRMNKNFSKQDIHLKEIKIESYFNYVNIIKLIIFYAIFDIYIFIYLVHFLWVHYSVKKTKIHLQMLQNLKLNNKFKM